MFALIPAGVAHFFNKKRIHRIDFFLVSRYNIKRYMFEKILVTRKV